jgi:hypothetical protein
MFGGIAVEGFTDRTNTMVTATSPAAARYFSSFFSTIFARLGENRREKEEKVVSCDATDH